MDRRLAVLAIVFGLLFFGCISSGEKKPVSTIEPVVIPVEVVQNTTNTSVQASPCAGFDNIVSSDACFSALAKEKGDFAYCENIYSISDMDSCLLPFALSDEKLCQKLSSSKSKQDCYESAAIRLNDTDYCVKISDSQRKENCLKAVSPPCSFEADEQSKQECLAVHYNSSSYCKNPSCFFELGVQNNNSGACIEIGDGQRALMSACKAVIANNSAVCNESGISTIADYCYQLSAYQLNNYNWCLLGTPGGKYVNECVTHFAVQNLNPSLCRDISPETERDNCYINYSAGTGNSSICKRVINSLLQSECYFRTATRNGDLSACNALAYSGRTNCYNIVITGSVPIPTADSCKAIIDIDPWLYRCYSQYAWQSKDKSACNLIENKKYKDDCIFRFS
ncbi:MAG: hypothetical protein WC492_02440 [Candidatus Micrarchaeia archaeon]